MVKHERWNIIFTKQTQNLTIWFNEIVECMKAKRFPQRTYNRSSLYKKRKIKGEHDELPIS